MFDLRIFAVIVALLLPSLTAAAAEGDAEKVLDLFSGTWSNEVVRKDANAAGELRLKVVEVAARSLKDRWLVVREINRESYAKQMSFMKWDPQEKQYVWTFFSSKGLYGTQWKSEWDDATQTLHAKSSDAPPTWKSDGTTRVLGKDKMEAHYWMKDDKEKLIFDAKFTKVRQPEGSAKAAMEEWAADHSQAVPLSPQLEVLEQFAGTWEVTAVAQKALWTPTETRAKSRVVRSWVLNRTFLQDVSHVDDGSEGIALFTFDPNRKQYRSWWFGSTGFAQSTGEWDVHSKTLRTKGELPDGCSSTGSGRVIDNDHQEWKVRITDRSGVVCFDCTWTCVRAKP